jgi:hypothetical protein
MIRFKRLLVLIAAAFVAATAQTAVAPSAGDGSKDDPYLISNLENLYWIAADDYSTVPIPTQAERWAAHYRQTTNINAAATSSWPGGWNPIGNSILFFSGSYDGGSFAIDSLYIDRDDNDQGLFGAYNGADTIKDLAVTHVRITSPNGSNIGTLVGYIIQGNVIGCSSSGTITANWGVGGVIGYTEGPVKFKYCSSSCTVNGYDFVGGLLGLGQYVTMEFCHASGIVSGHDNVGGLIGVIGSYSNITSCYANGSVTGTNENAGGLIGNVYYSNIVKSYSRATVQGKWVVGGLVGKNNINGFIENCYSHSIVHGVAGIGGLVGENEYAFVMRSYSSDTAYGDAYVGGLVGNDKWGASVVDLSFWNMDSSGLASSAGGTGLTESQMMIQLVYTDAEWDFVNVWEMIPGNYPRLRAIPDAALPTELISFTAVAKQGRIEVKWTTAAEVNNHGFEVERKDVSRRGGQARSMTQASSDHAPNLKRETTNTDWIRISFVEGSGNSNISHEYSYLDRSVSAGTYSYRLKQIDRDGKFRYSQEVETSISVPPVHFALEQNFPNPFNPSTMIGYQVPMNGEVTLIVFDALGREVAVIVNEIKTAGTYTVPFDASSFAAGVYFYRLRSGNSSITKRMVLLK